ncbi:MAG: DUF6580 family putative transport protein [Opitutales bacterium]
MQKTKKPEPQIGSHVLGACLILAVGCWRVLAPGGEEWSNFSPLMALFFCGAIYLRGDWRWVIPGLALVCSDLILNYRLLGSPVAAEWWMAANYGCYALAFGLGYWASRGKSWLKLGGGLVVGSLLFYVITSTAAWMAHPAYLKSVSGWAQALTIGDPAFQPQAWTFLRNSLVSDLLFGGLFAGIMEWTAARSGAPSLLAKDRRQAIA